MGLYFRPGLVIQILVIGFGGWAFPSPEAVAQEGHDIYLQAPHRTDDLSHAEDINGPANGFLDDLAEGKLPKTVELEKVTFEANSSGCQCDLLTVDAIAAMPDLAEGWADDWADDWVVADGPLVNADTDVADPEVSASAAPLVSLPVTEQTLAKAEAGQQPVENSTLNASSHDVDASDGVDALEPVHEVDAPTHGEDAETAETEIDDELGILRVRSQPVGVDGELGVLRVRPTEDLPLEEPQPTKQAEIFLTGRANVYGGNNLFRTPDPIDDRIYQTGLGLFAFPRLGETTNLILSAEANIARYEDLSHVDYDEIQFQAGIRQRLGSRSYGQLNWRYQELSAPSSDPFFWSHYVEFLLSRRDILNNRTWLDAYYQARLSMSSPREFSRFSQIATGSINYGFNPTTRASLLYQLFLDDYTENSRHDTYHQVLAQFSHDLSSTTRLSLFTGLRFGRSSRSSVDFYDTIYGASINVNVPLF